MPDYVRSHELRSVTAGANLVSGDVVLTSDRMVGYVEAQRGIANTEVGFVRVRGVVRFTKASSSEVIAAGDRIQYNTTTKLVSAFRHRQPGLGLDCRRPCGGSLRKRCHHG
jgi:hypothetical protein